MAVKIRLSRVGKKHRPFFRMIAMDSRKKRDGATLANIGTYDPLNGSIVQFHENLYNEWIEKGALPTDSAKKIYKIFKKSGISASKKGDEVKKEAEKAPKEETPKKQAAKKEEAPKVEKPVEATEKKEATEKVEETA